MWGFFTHVISPLTEISKIRHSLHNQRSASKHKKVCMWTHTHLSKYFHPLHHLLREHFCKKARFWGQQHISKQQNRQHDKNEHGTTITCLHSQVELMNSSHSILRKHATFQGFTGSILVKHKQLTSIDPRYTQRTPTTGHSPVEGGIHRLLNSSLPCEGPIISHVDCHPASKLLCPLDPSTQMEFL